MHHTIRYRQGKRFLPSPYLKGVFIRDDIFWKRFVVLLHGEVHYPEDEPIFGTYSRDTTIELSRHGFIEEAMIAAEAVVRSGAYPLDEDEHEDALFFNPRKVCISDLFDRHVLSGDAKGGGIRWLTPVESDKEAEQLAKQADRLRSEADIERGWDNFSTAANLRWQACKIEGQLVDPFWREHARAAIAALKT